MDHNNILEESNSLSAENIWHTAEIRKKAHNWNQYRDARLIGEKYEIEHSCIYLHCTYMVYF